MRKFILVTSSQLANIEHRKLVHLVDDKSNVENVLEGRKSSKFK